MAEQLEWRKWSERQCLTCRQWIDTEVDTRYWNYKTCPDCQLRAAKDWRERNPDRVSWNAVKGKFGITQQEWLALYDKQGGKCGICHKDIAAIPSKGGAYTDHDHTTGKVRGLLCNRCNGLLAGVDDRNWLGNALAYLDKG